MKRTVILTEETYSALRSRGEGMSDAPLGTPEKIIKAMLAALDAKGVSKSELLAFAES